MIETAPRRLKMARWLVQGTALGSAAVLLRIVIYLATSAFKRDPHYVVGCLEGIGIDLVFGLVTALPLLAGGAVFEVLAGVLGVVYIAATAAAAHVHAVLLYLPSRDSLVYLKELKSLESSIREHAPLWEAALEILVPVAASLWAGAWAAPRLERGLLEPRYRRTLALAAVGTIALASSARATAVHGQEYYGAIGPIVHVTQPDAHFDLRTAQPSRDVVADVERGLATDNMGPPEDTRYPFCVRSPPPPAGGKTGRSALLLVLESVDTRSFELTVDGVPVMPNLKRMAADGVLFPRFFSTGNMSVYALPPLLGGLPAAPVHALLMRTPLDHVLGFPDGLRRVGFETAYLHAADLSFSHEDEFVRRVGFENVVPMPADLPRYGWGASDGAMLGMLEGYIDRIRRNGSKPYFITAFTVSTHDPYTLPPDYRRRFKGDTAYDRFVESLGYLDGELGRFYEWYSKNELPRGTVLAVTGDHAPRVAFPGDHSDTTTGELEFRFQVPLILLGLTPDEAARARHNAAKGIGGHQDVPATLAAALGVAPPRCHLGRNLLGDDIPEARIVPSVAGNMLQFLYAHRGTQRYMLEARRRRRFVGFDYVSDPTFRRDIAQTDPHAREVLRFLSEYIEVMAYAVNEDKFAPPTAPVRPRSALPRVAVARRVARVGGTPGTQDAGVLDEVDRALGRKPDDIELSTTMSSHGDVVVRHWKEPDPAEGSGLSIGHPDTTAEGPPLGDVLVRVGERAGLFLDVERPAKVGDVITMVHGIAEAVARLSPELPVVVESSDEAMLTSIRQFSPVALAYRITPEPVMDAPLDFAAERGFGWVSLRADHATPEAIVAAHARGLRVITYPSDFPTLSADAGAEEPDARIVN